MTEPHVPAPYHFDTQHNGTYHMAIRNTRMRRFLILMALQTTARLYRGIGPGAPISKHLIVKSGQFTHLTEAATMEFVAANTSIPVPRVYCSFVHNNEAYIVMERMPGESIGKVWSTLSASDRESILAQLRAMLQELRSLKPPPGTGVQSCEGGSLIDPRNTRSRPRFGLFDSIAEFHVWLRDYFQPTKAKPNHLEEAEWQDLVDMTAKQDTPWPPPVFTHGDLNPSNIFVRGSKVIGIMDWRCAGWYPHYWEYTSAWCGNVTRGAWQRVLHNFLDPYPEELEMEKTRQRWWGEI
jgi:aminoglycoside phosphotransferase